MFNPFTKKDTAKPLPHNFYLKLSAYILLIAVLPVLIIGTLSYASLKKALVNEISLWNQHVNENSKSAFELNFNQMLYQSAYLITNNITKDYESVYNSISYENNSVRKPNEDLNGLNEYLFYKKNLIKMMSSIKINNKYIDDIYFYDSEKDMILNTDGKQYNKETFYDKEWYASQESNKSSFSRMDVRTVSLRGMDKNIVTLIYSSASKNNSFIVNINISDMYNGIMKGLSSLEGDSYIYSKETGKLIRNNESENTAILTALGGPDQIIDWTEASQTVNDQYLVSWVKSERLGWYFINIKDLEHYYVNIAKSKNVMLVSSGVMLLLLLVLSSMLFLRIYSTLKKLLQDKFNIQNKLNENVPALQKLFKYDLLKGKIYSPDEIAKKMTELRLDVPEQNLVVLLAQCEGGINEQVRGIFDLLLHDSSGFSADIDGQLCCVLHIPKQEMKLLDLRIQTARDKIRTASSSSIAIGVGRFCETRGELNRAFIEAFEALKYRFVYGNEEIIFFDDIKLSDQKHYSYPFEKEKALRNYIMIGNLEDAQNVLRGMIDEMTNSSNVMSYTRLQQYSQMLVSGMMKTVDMLGVDIDEVFGSHTNGLMTIDISTSKEDFFNKCSHMLDTIMNYVSCESKKKSSKDMELLVSFMDKNFRTDISLIDAAEVVGLNPSYVSRLIKNHTGKNFTDYVADRRMRLAEHLLLTTDLKLDDITGQIGYQNTYYFIKVFRKYYGTTPSKFRHANRAATDIQMGYSED